MAQSPPIDAWRTYFTLDEMDLLEQARHEPEAPLLSAKRITLDEAQRAPAMTSERASTLTFPPPGTVSP